MPQAWFNDKTVTEICTQFVEDMKSPMWIPKPANFRLPFMTDEVGQYVGTDTDMLFRTQPLTENRKECEGNIQDLY